MWKQSLTSVYMSSGKFPATHTEMSWVVMMPRHQVADNLTTGIA